MFNFCVSGIRIRIDSLKSLYIYICIDIITVQR